MMGPHQQGQLKGIYLKTVVILDPKSGGGGGNFLLGGGWRMDAGVKKHQLA